MPLQPIAATKLDLYTLACRELLTRLDELNDATHLDTRLDYDACLRMFDEVLSRFFLRSSARTLPQACPQFTNMLFADANLYRSLNTRAVAVFDAIIASIGEQAATWQYTQDLERFHTQGRELARRFFAASPWPTTQTRLANTCSLIVEYGAALDGRVGPSDDRVAPAGHRARYPNAAQDEILEQVVLLRFDFRHTFASYLSYPFLFLHEYTAHVYATDHENDIFNDGWMLYAADAFLTRLWNSDAEAVGLNREQVKIFQNYWYPSKLNPLPLRGCNFARDLDSWLGATTPDWFTRVTYELAAFQPNASQSAIWPTRFIYALERAFRTDRRQLLAMVRAAPDAQTLMRLMLAK
jgi:hypothetical protein